MLLMATDQKQPKSQEDDITYHHIFILAVLLHIFRYRLLHILVNFEC